MTFAMSSIKLLAILLGLGFPLSLGPTRIKVQFPSSKSGGIGTQTVIKLTRKMRGKRDENSLEKSLRTCICVKLIMNKVMFVPNMPTLLLCDKLVYSTIDDSFM